MRQFDLFAETSALPSGFRYRAEFIAAADEAAILDVIRTLPLKDAQYKQYTARRRTVSYGSHA